MAKHKSHTGELVVLAGGGLVAYLIWKNQQAQAGAVAPAAAASASGSAGVAQLLSPSASSSASVAAPGPSLTPPATIGTVAALIPAVPLNSPPTNVGTANGTQIIEETPVSTPSGTVLPSNFAVVNNPITGLQPVVDIVPASSTGSQVIQVPNPAPTPSQTTTPSTTPILQAPVNISASGAVFPNNNPAGAQQGAAYPSVTAGLTAAFRELWALYNAAPNAFTISGIANNWVNVVGDGLPWGQGGDGSTQTTFENAMVALTGFGDYTLEPHDQATMIRLMRGIVGTVSGAQNFGTIPDATMQAAYAASLS